MTAVKGSLMRVKLKRVSCPTESEGSFIITAKVKRMSATMQEPAKKALKTTPDRISPRS